MDAKKLEIDTDWMQSVLMDLLRIPSPTGRTDEAMQYVGETLKELEIPFALTRRGALLADLQVEDGTPHRAVVTHVDTIGAQVRAVNERGRLELVPVGTHNARFSEGARVTVFTDVVDRSYTGTILAKKASGHAYGDEVDTQGVGWDHVEVRVDAHVSSRAEAAELGIRVGDFVALQALPQITPNGFVKSRHLDDKGGIAAVLAASKAVLEADVDLPVSTHLLITISEEVGHGASHGLHEDVAEMLSVDIGVVAPPQHSTEQAVTIAMADRTGPFDYHLTRRLLGLADAHGVEHRRDVFRHYRSDVAAALEAGAEMRAALIGFGVDATHGHERTHLDGLRATAELVALYLQTELTFSDWDRQRTGSLEDFPSRSVQPADQEPRIEQPTGDD